MAHTSDRRALLKLQESRPYCFAKKTGANTIQGQTKSTNRFQNHSRALANPRCRCALSDEKMFRSSEVHRQKYPTSKNRTNQVSEQCRKIPLTTSGPGK